MSPLAPWALPGSPDPRALPQLASRVETMLDLPGLEAISCQTRCTPSLRATDSLCETSLSG